MIKFPGRIEYNPAFWAASNTEQSFYDRGTDFNDSYKCQTGFQECADSNDLRGSEVLSGLLIEGMWRESSYAVYATCVHPSAVR